MTPILIDVSPMNSAQAAPEAERSPIRKTVPGEFDSPGMMPASIHASYCTLTRNSTTRVAPVSMFWIVMDTGYVSFGVLDGTDISSPT